MITKIELNAFRAEIKADLIKINRMIAVCRSNKTLAIELTIGGVYTYYVERNKNVICMLKKERKTLKRKINK
jgi:hypothetical protein